MGSKTFTLQLIEKIFYFGHSNFFFFKSTNFCFPELFEKVRKSANTEKMASFENVWLFLMNFFQKI